MREVIVVFQDCALCGVKGRQTIAEYAEKGIALRKVSFISPEGRELCAKAVEIGIGVMPFYTDGKTFATSIEGVVANEPIKKSSAKNKKARKEKNGAISKN